MNVLNYILIAIILILTIIILSSYKKLNYICKTLDEVLQGNFNQRIRLQNHIKPLNILSIKTNSIIERLQNINADNKISEESRKKMISNISHDLRTPLTSMLGYMELILDDNALNNKISDKNNTLDKDEILDSSTLSVKQKEEYLKIVYSKGNYLYNLMEEFFRVSKLDSNDVRLEIKEVNISEIIRENIVSFFNEIKKLNIEPEINIPEEDVYGFTDEKSLNRILSNLINNVLKHGSQATLIGISLNYDARNIYIDVYDNGTGIPEDEINYVFDRLYTVEKSRKVDLRSSGLGLTIVKKLVQALDGSISVYSIPFEKTVFTFTLPKKLNKAHPKGR